MCVNPIHVKRVSDRMAQAASTGYRPAIVSVAGFPLGASTTEIKAEEARQAIGDGATEIDMVALVGSLIEGDRKAVRSDIEAVSNVVHQTTKGGVLKVILECGALTQEQIILGCRCCAEGEADFVKTSTGMHASGGATVEIVRLLHRHASPILVKASGGIRTLDAARIMVAAGAARIGTSSGVAIVRQLKTEVS